VVLISVFGEKRREKKAKGYAGGEVGAKACRGLREEKKGGKGAEIIAREGKEKREKGGNHRQEL